MRKPTSHYPTDPSFPFLSLSSFFSFFISPILYTPSRLSSFTYTLHLLPFHFHLPVPLSSSLPLPLLTGERGVTSRQFFGITDANRFMAHGPFNQEIQQFHARCIVPKTFLWGGHYSLAVWNGFIRVVNFVLV
jgi:hypothetical protein